MFRHNWGVDALALDPQDSDTVYAAFGMYTNSWWALQVTTISLVQKIDIP